MRRRSIRRTYKYAIVSCSYTDETLSKISDGTFRILTDNATSDRVLKELSKSENIFILKAHDIKYESVTLSMTESEFIKNAKIERRT